MNSNLQALLARLEPTHARTADRYPGDRPDRQPAHTVYGGADLFRADSARKLGDLALRALEAHAPHAAALASAIDLPGAGDLHETVYDRVRRKLGLEPVEDFRIDFEDGFGHRPDQEEDETARQAADEVARGLQDATLPPFIGIRIKPLTRELGERALRTLDLFVSTLVERTDGRLPPGFVVTLPKVAEPAEVEVLGRALEELEEHTGLDAGALELELMVELPRTIIGPDGRSPLPALVDAADGRCRGAHFGVYDFTAGAGITAEFQHMRHPICDAARDAMLIALSGMGVMLSDGATNTLPVPRHRAAEGERLTEAQREQNTESVHAGWKLHYDDIRHSLTNGFYQGWDLHPAQLVTRYAALYAFFLEGLDAAAERLANFVERAARATLTGDVFDDAATGQGLLNFFLRGLNCGALMEEEALVTGLTVEELRSRSFLSILEGQREGA